MIKTEDKQWRQWKINVVSELYPSKENGIQCVHVKI